MADTAAIMLDPNHSLFRSEYEAELESWLRRRFRTVAICYAIVTVLVLLVRVPMILTKSDPLTPVLVTIAAGAASLAVLWHFLTAPHWTTATRPQLLRAAYVMILLVGGISLVKSYILEFTSPIYRTEFIVPLFFWHLIACCLLPWRPRESLKPVLPLLALWALGVLLHLNAPLPGRISSVLLSPLVLVPGLGICALRLQYHSESFRTRMVGKLFHSMRQEFIKARSIHESLFPKPHEDEYLRFEYTYKPMRELGGDYVHLELTPDGLMHVCLIDVTGHGLPSALTVNRLHGELERIRGESPQAEPGEVLTLLNRYIHLTLIKHNIFVTAMCMTLDPNAGKLHWASAGHPPGFLRGVNGRVTPLPATTVLLGAVDGREFVADQRTIELSPGDVIVAYTDGAFEARNRLGEPLGLDRLSRLLDAQPAPKNWPQFIAAAVQKHGGGKADDDILVAALTLKAMRPAPVEPGLVESAKS